MKVFKAVMVTLNEKPRPDQIYHKIVERDNHGTTKALIRIKIHEQQRNEKTTTKRYNKIVVKHTNFI